MLTRRKAVKSSVGQPLWVTVSAFSVGGEETWRKRRELLLLGDLVECVTV